MLKRLRKIDNQVAILLVLTTVALGLNYTIERQFEITPTSGWGSYSVDDRRIGGNSVAEDRSDDSHYVLEYTIGDQSPSPYALLLIEPPMTTSAFGANEYPPPECLFDWSWVEEVLVTAHTSKKAKENFRLQFRNYEEEVFNPSNNASLKYNEVCLKLTDHPTTHALPINKFYVPGWWIERTPIELSDSTPKFDKIVRVEIGTGNIVRGGSGDVIVERIVVSGHWVSPTTLMRGIIGMWLGFAIWVVGRHINRLRKSLLASQSHGVALQKQTADLAQLAKHDPLTQLLNRRGVRDHVTIAMDSLERDNEIFSLIILDVDDFKKINDAHGHSHGDKVLQNIASLVVETVSARESVARWGGEEFLIICPKSDLCQATDLAQTLRQKIESDLGLTCSFGVCQLTRSCEFTEALDVADRCLYQAKSNDKNCVVAQLCRDASDS